MVTTHVLPLDAEDATLETVGGKGKSLAKMVAAKLPVPDGFHLATSAYRRFVEENDLQARILDIAAGATARDAASFDAASTGIQALFERNELSTKVVSEIRKAYASLGKDPAVAVRSSANAEDLPDMSFAGQQDTYLNVRGEDALLAAVLKCWASLWTPRAISYRDRMGIAHDQVAMAVVVQIMVPSDVSGILFTANPATGERSEMVANASFGLGEAIVSGQVTPDTYVIDRDSLKAKETIIGAKEQMIVSGEQGTKTEEVSEAQRGESSLSAPLLGELASLAKDIEAHFDGVPQDIEWAVAGGKLWLLQSRPITNLPPQPLKDVKWEPPVPGARLIRRQVVENMPDPLSPLFDELYLEIGLEEAMDRMMERANSPQRMSDIAPGQVHVTVNGYAYQRSDFGKVKSKRKIDPEVLRRHGIWGQRNWWLEYTAYWRQEGLPQYLAIIEDWRELDAASASDEKLLEGVLELAKADAYYWEENSKVFATAKVTDEQLQRFLTRNAPDSGFTSGTFLSGFKSRTLQAQSDMWEITKQVQANEVLCDLVINTPAGRLLEALENHPDGGPIVEAFRGYLDTYGHQIYSLDFAEPTEGEDPTVALVSLKTQVQDKDYTPTAHQPRLARNRKDALKKANRYFRGDLQWEFRRVLWMARHYYPNRDEVVFYLGAAWPVLRTFALELGRRMVEVGTFLQPDDTFFLRTDDLRKAMSARIEKKALPDLGRKAADERELREARKRLHPPGTIPMEASGAMEIKGRETQKLNDPSSNVMSGFAVSPGTITGEVSLVNSPADFDKMKPGTILCCPMTTPAWTQLFSHAIALVTDIGSILAHGSIVAREYGIPAVLGLGNVTQRLKSGDRISVDGTKGIVEILSK